jgi:glycine/sarcosine/betaine reductase complex component A
MDLDEQGSILDLVGNVDPHDVVVLLGSPDANATELVGITLTSGDPTWAGPLAGVQLGLPVYHILEPEIKAQIPADVYEQQVGIMEMALNTEELCAATRELRTQMTK